jgi:hypothetical protein
MDLPQRHTELPQVIPMLGVEEGPSADANRKLRIGPRPKPRPGPFRMVAALDAAAAALEPAYDQPESASSGQTDTPDTLLADEVTSQSTSQSGILDGEGVESVEEIGSPHWTIFATGSSVEQHERSIRHFVVR